MLMIEKFNLEIQKQKKKMNGRNPQDLYTNLYVKYFTSMLSDKMQVRQV